jgi:hypothetical protein
MSIFNYSQICSNLLKGLPRRQKEVLSRRYGLKSGQRETLEFIGRTFGVTRERVRQIEKDGFSKIGPKIKKYQKVFQYFREYLKSKGGLKKEDLLLEHLGGKNWQNQVFFLLTLPGNFKRFTETSDFYSFWTINQDPFPKAKKVIDSISNKLKKIGKPLKLKELTGFSPLTQKVLVSYLEISKKIQENSEGFFGLKDWPEINPRGVKDKAFLVFEKEKRPLHFSQVANLIGSALPQTVHNELIKDPRFVLVGRGIYALKEWGYEEGVVKDIILKVLKEAQKPLTKEEILEKTLKQRLVKENTILLNLSNKKYFLRTPEGHYKVKEA